MAYDAYITETYYNDTYKGPAIDSDVFDRIALRASDEVDRITFQGIRRAGISSFDTDTQTAIQMAACAIAEALAQIDTATDGTGIAVTSEKVGSYSYSTDAAGLTALKAAAITRACQFLLFTGLLYAGI